MNCTDFVTPISFSDRDQVELSHSNGSLDGSLNFFVAFPAQSKIVFLITNNSISFEASSLTSLSLLLDRFDFHNFFFDGSTEESVNNFLFFDGDGESEDIKETVDKFALD